MRGASVSCTYGQNATGRLSTNAQTAAPCSKIQAPSISRLSCCNLIVTQQFKS